MNSKFYLASFAAAVVLFLAGWVVYGMVLMSYFSAHSVMKTQPAMWGIILGSLSHGFLYAYVCSVAKATGFMKGLTTGIMVAIFVTLGTDFFMVSSNMYDSVMPIIVDVIGEAVLGGLAGGTAAVVFGMGQAKPAA